MAKIADLSDASLVQLFIGLRDRRAKRKADYDLDDAGDKDRQNKIETDFLRRFNEQGTDSVSSREFGTAYRSTRSSATVADWDIFFGHVQDNDAWELIERRPSKKAVQEFREANDDMVPGLNWSETQVVNFRRK